MPKGVPNGRADTATFGLSNTTEYRFRRAPGSTPYPGSRYQMRQVNSIRMPLGRDPAIKRFCELSAKYYRAANEGELADYHGPVILSEQATRYEMERHELQAASCRRYDANSPDPISP